MFEAGTTNNSDQLVSAQHPLNTAGRQFAVSDHQEFATALGLDP